MIWRSFIFLFFLITMAGSAYSQDSIVFNPGKEIRQGFLRELFLGEGYRAVWNTDVKAPVLDLEEMGLKPVKVGGRLETSSLRFKDSRGRSFVGRSVNKDLSRMLSEKRRKGIMGKALKDHASANEPYAALAVADLAEKLRIIHATPVLYVLPKDTSMGKFAAEFNGLPVLFEERPSKSWIGDPVFGSPSEIIDTEKLIKKRFENAGIIVDKEMYLRGRLLDMLVGDWSRHDEQYRWALVPKDSGHFAFPIPKDRDHAFYKKEGILNKLSGIVWPYPRNFTSSIKKVHLLNHMAGNMDKLILPEVTRDDWFRITKEFLSVIDTNAIKDALKKLPKETYAIDGKELENKLSSRLKELPVASMDFYKQVNSTPFIPASDKKDRILLALYGDSVKVIIKRNDGTAPYFERTFNYQDTKLITIAALDGKDKIEMTGKRSRIRINILQGPSEDELITSTDELDENVILFDTKPRKIYDYLTIGIKKESKHKKKVEPEQE